MEESSYLKKIILSIGLKLAMMIITTIVVNILIKQVSMLLMIWAMMKKNLEKLWKVL